MGGAAGPDLSRLGHVGTRGVRSRPVSGTPFSRLLQKTPDRSSLRGQAVISNRWPGGSKNVLVEVVEQGRARR